MRSCTRAALFLVVLVVLALGVSGTSHPARVRAQTATSQAYVGRLEGADAFIAIVLSGSQVVAYVCDGNERDVSLWGWFQGEVTGPRVELASTNGHGLALELGGGAAPRGSLRTSSGARLDFRTEAASGSAGLWRAQGVVDGAPLLAGWVVLNDGQVRGAKVSSGTASGQGFTTPPPDVNTQPVSIESSTLVANRVGFTDPLPPF